MIRLRLRPSPRLSIRPINRLQSNSKDRSGGSGVKLFRCTSKSTFCCRCSRIGGKNQGQTDQLSESDIQHFSDCWYCVPCVRLQIKKINSIKMHCCGSEAASFHYSLSVPPTYWLHIVSNSPSTLNNHSCRKQKILQHLRGAARNIDILLTACVSTVKST